MGLRFYGNRIVVNIYQNCKESYINVRLGDLSSCVSEVLAICFSGSLSELKKSVQKLLVVDSPDLKEQLEKQNKKQKEETFLTSLELSALEFIRDSKQHCVAHIAAAGGNLEVLQTLLTSSPNLAHIEDENGENALFYAIRALNNYVSNPRDIQKTKDKEEIVNRSKPVNDRLDCLLLLIGISGVNCMSKHGTSPLHVASELGDAKICKILLENNANVNICSEAFGTPLSVAAARGYLDVLELLLEHGADPNGVSTLEENNNSINNRDNKDNSKKINNNNDENEKVFPPPLVFASSTGQEDIVRRLLEYGADANLGDYEGWTPLHCASESGFLNVCKMLVEYKADPNIKIDNKNPYHLAVLNGHVEVAEYLKDYTDEVDLLNFVHLNSSDSNYKGIDSDNDDKDSNSSYRDKNNDKNYPDKDSSTCVTNHSTNSNNNTDNNNNYYQQDQLMESEMSVEEIENVKILVNEAKNCGKELVNLGDFSNATHSYTKALSICPVGPSFRELRSILYSNRSFTNLKSKRLKEALEDAKQTVKLAPNWSKGYLRVANVYKEMGETIDYLHNLFQAFVRDSKNKELRTRFQTEFHKKMIVESCLTDCYKDLPQPEFVLSPEDSELNYFLWMPGFKYKPTFQQKLTTLKSLSSSSDSTLEEVLEDMIEVDVLEKSFNNKAKGGLLDAHVAGVLARELGGAPSQADLLEFEATYGNKVNFDNFKEFLAVSMYSNENKEYFQELMGRFQNADNGVTLKKFENLLKNYGEPLTDAEFNAVVKMLKLENNVVLTNDLVNLLRPE